MFSFLSAEIPEILFEDGNRSMSEGNYKDAIQAYESILKLGYETGDLYYNLGNAYYRLHSIGLSAWAYYNALSMKPRDKDIIHNLQVTQARQVDRIEMPEPFILLDIYRRAKDIFTFRELLFMGSCLLLVEALLVFFIQFGLLLGSLYRHILTLMIIVTLGVHGIAIDKYFQNKRSHYGVIIANGVNTYSGPYFEENTVLFRINEGMKVEIHKTQDDWIEIILIDGKKGWIPTESIRILR
jgi:tetratricopeptide (TPR) repeat protein